MKLKSKALTKMSRKKTVALITTILIVIVGASLFGVWYFTNQSQNNSTTTKSVNEINYDTPNQEQIENGESIKENSYSQNLGGSDQPASPTPIEGSEKSNVEIYITHASQVAEGGALDVGVEISSVQSAGTCTLKLTSPGQSSITVTADVQPLAKTSTCKGFSVSSVPAGKWSATLIFQSNSLTGTATYNNIVVK